jgi:hypothetical protein
MENKIGTSNKALTRRDYFTGCALQALLRTKGPERGFDHVVNEAIEIGALVDAKLDADSKEADEPKSKGA